MEGSNVAVALDAVEMESGAERQDRPDKSELHTAPRIKQALALLLDGLEYAHDLGGSVWDFAVELSSMRSLNLSTVDLRWLIARGYLDYAVEVTLAGDSLRSFRQPPRPLFNKRACFVLTDAGAELARGLCDTNVRVIPTGRKIEASHLSITPALEALVPKWDRERQELRVGSIIVKRFKVPAANQEAVLAAFEEEGWPVRIDDPLSPGPDQCPKRRLQETIKSLNRNHHNPLLHFLGDGSGQGVRWEFSKPSAEQ